MSQEIEGGTGLPLPSPSESKSTDDFNMCPLSIIFLIVGVLTLLLGLIQGVLASDGYRTEGWAILYFVGGALTGLFNFALAVIVDACQKYRECHKN